MVLLSALARNVLRVFRKFGSLYKATSVILWCYPLHLRETCLCIVAQFSALARNVYDVPEVSEPRV